MKLISLTANGGSLKENIDLCPFLGDSIPLMGKQYNKEIKKRRRQAYLKRRKAEQSKK
jgi:hypothetical protein